MAALTAAANTKRLNAESVLSELTLPVKGSTIIYGGATVCTDSSGYAKGAVAATGLKCWGVAEETVDNRLGADGTLYVKVRCGSFDRAVGTSADALAVTDIGAIVYAIDDHTVGKTDGSGTRSPAALFLGYETDGVPYFLVNYQVLALAAAAAASTAENTAEDARLTSLEARVTALEGP
jgi:hypothetical protein